jgi:hypothetical protein
MRPSLRPFVVPGICFAVFTGLAAAFAFRAEVLYDTDSYFHLFVGRIFRELGVVDEFPWTRFSVYRDGFGDKEVLFHLLLAPFAGDGSSTAGGRLALALLLGGIAAMLAGLSQRAVGAWALLAPVIVYFGSIDFLGRAVRLRPELLALMLFLAATWCAAERRHRLLGLVAFTFALAYTGFHALLVLCGLWFAWSWFFERRREWLLLLYPVLGTGLALLVHPHFPHNLVVWKVQNVDFFLIASQLDVSTENRAPSLVATFRDNWGWAAACLGLWLGRGWIAAGRTGKADVAKESETEQRTHRFAVWAIAAAAFAVLYVLMLRFSTYFYAFGVLALLFAVPRFPSSATPRSTQRLAAVGAMLLALLSLVAPARMLWGMATATGGALSREADWAAAAQALPAGARVAADWGLTPNVLYYAPHAQFMNVLNSVFMAVPYPDEYRAWSELLAGRSEDPVAVVRDQLDSQYLVLSRFFTEPRLLQQLEENPGVQRVYAGYTLVYRLHPNTSPSDPAQSPLAVVHGPPMDDCVEAAGPCPGRALPNRRTSSAAHPTGDENKAFFGTARGGTPVGCVGSAVGPYARRASGGDAGSIAERAQHRRRPHAAPTPGARGFAAAGCVGPPARCHSIAFVGRALPAAADPRAQPHAGFTTGC